LDNETKELKGWTQWCDSLWPSRNRPSTPDFIGTQPAVQTTGSTPPQRAAGHVFVMIEILYLFNCRALAMLIVGAEKRWRGRSQRRRR
jgi:hypothetical protein